MASISDDKLAAILLDGEFVDEESLNHAVRLAKESKIPLEKVILEKELLTDSHMGQIIAAELGYPFIDLRLQSVDIDLMMTLPEAFAEQNKVLVYSEKDDEVHVAINDPKNEHLIQLLEKRLNKKLVFHYATANDLHQSFNLYKRDLDKKILALTKHALRQRKGKKDDEKDEDTEVIQIMDLLFEYAYSSKASDLHIEPQEVETVIRFRVDGVLDDRLFLPKRLHDRLMTRIKILAHLRTDEHHAAQDGHMDYRFSGEKVDMRVSILPTTYGEKVVLRLLSEKSRQFSIEELGLSPKDLVKLKEQARKPWGMILVTGPTGSGKTTTLYAVLKILNNRGVNISTIEDPVEYSLLGVNQIQVNTKTELTFSRGLRSIVRQDPDIIMVGEIRDNETADIAVNAALTGHLLLSTLHTNDAATSLPRLMDMGIEPFLVASTVNIIMAQRLLRRICMKCITSYESTVEELEEDGFLVPEKMKEALFAKGKQRLYKGEGCKVCNHSGYLGRIGAFEILQVDAEVRKMIVDQASSDAIRDYAISKGMSTMFDDGIKKVLEGQTTIEELIRVVRD